MSVWTDEAVTKLAKLWRDGLSCTQISRQIPGTTRNSIIGKVIRLGLPSHSRSQVRPMLVQRKTYAAPPPPAAPKPKLAPRDGNVIALVAPGNGVDLISSPEATRTWRGNALPGRHQCKWPLGDPAKSGFTFCDRVAVLRDDGTERPYCGFHCELAFMPPKARNSGRELVRGLRRYI